MKIHMNSECKVYILLFFSAYYQLSDILLNIKLSDDSSQVLSHHQYNFCNFGHHCWNVNKHETVWSFRQFNLLSVLSKSLYMTDLFLSFLYPSYIPGTKGSSHTNRPTTLFLSHTKHWCNIWATQLRVSNINKLVFLYYSFYCLL